MSIIKAIICGVICGSIAAIIGVNLADMLIK